MKLIKGIRKNKLCFLEKEYDEFVKKIEKAFEEDTRKGIRRERLETIGNFLFTIPFYPLMIILYVPVVLIMAAGEAIRIARSR